MEIRKKIHVDKNSINQTIDAAIWVEGNRVLIDCGAGADAEPYALLVFEGRETIIWERTLSETERMTGKITEDFRGFADSWWAQADYSYRIALRCRAEGEPDSIAIVKNSRMKDAFYEPIEIGNLVLVPYHMKKDRQFAVRLSTPEMMMVKFIHCEADRVKYNGSRFFISMELEKPEHPITGVFLMSRRGNKKYPMEYSASENGNRLSMQASIDLQTVELVDPFWNICIETIMFDHPVWIQPSVSDKLEKHLKLSTFHGKLEHDLIFFAKPLKTKVCQLVIRKKEFFDAPGIRIKELLAILAAKAAGPLFAGKGYWLVFEKFCSAAQDNGYAFFRFCMENLSEKERKHIFYVIDRNAGAYQEVSKYGKNVIPFMSFRHMLYSLIADIYVASESKAHLYAWRGKPSMVYSKIRNKPIFFLQHGVLALKRVDNIFGKTGTDPMDYFLTSSKQEQDIVVDNYGYQRERVPILGLARWDRLYDTSSDTGKTILVMPTWRKWIQDSGEDAFMDSEFFKSYSGLLCNEKLISALRNNGVRMQLYMHPKFKQYMSEAGNSMQVDTDCCELISFGEKPLNELIQSSRMLITDYSSVCWDFFYQGKPIIFYQFDYDLYMANHGSYIDMTKELFGDRCLDEDRLVDAVLEYIANGFQNQTKFVTMRQEQFAYLDHDNCRRTYEFIKNRS